MLEEVGVRGVGEDSGECFTLRCGSNNAATDSDSESDLATGMVLAW